MASTFGISANVKTCLDTVPWFSPTHAHRRQLISCVRGASLHHGHSLQRRCLHVRGHAPSVSNMYRLLCRVIRRDVDAWRNCLAPMEWLVGVSTPRGAILKFLYKNCKNLIACPSKCQHTDKPKCYLHLKLCFKNSLKVLGRECQRTQFLLSKYQNRWWS